MLLATLAMMPLFHGWWNLGREVSLSPVEIAMAFKAPHTDGGDANADVSTLLKQIGKRRAQYGVIATEFQGGGVGGGGSTRDLNSPGFDFGPGITPIPSLGISPGPISPTSPGASTLHGPPSIMLRDLDAKNGAYSPEPRSPLAIADPKLLRRPSRNL